MHALIDYSRIISVSDDLESFFHVLLYFAIRFLPHNASPRVVPMFLYYYFDDYTDGERCQTAGSTKCMAMKQGEINITQFTGSKVGQNGQGIDQFLTFLWPDDDTASEPTEEVNQHPIDVIISDLLLWFKALYAQDKQVENKRVGVQNKAKRVLGNLSLTLPGMALSATPLIPSTTLSQPTEADKQAELKVAQKLDTQDPMIQFLTECVMGMEWPDGDKGEDKKPKNGYSPPQDNIPATSTKIGSKRGMENGEAEPTSKRVRSKARA